MPVYEYECAAHGLFDDVRTFAESALPSPCPICATSCDRIVSLPTLKVMDRGLSKAHERNERSRHEPLRHKGKLDSHPVFRGKAQRGHECTASCSHGAEASAAERKAQSFTTYTGARPWVIEHSQGASLT